MAGAALGRRASEDSIGMALRAGHACMRPGQREVGAGVVKCGRFPGQGRMTGGAIISILPVVGIHLRMASSAVCRRAFVNLIHMAARAVHRLVRPGQREIGTGVVKGSWFPTLRGMANSALTAKLTGMGIILKVAVRTAGRRVLKHHEAAAASMAALAIHRQVLTGQSKGHPVMIKGCAIAVNAIVTGNAVRSKRL